MMNNSLKCSKFIPPELNYAELSEVFRNFDALITVMINIFKSNIIT